MRILNSPAAVCSPEKLATSLPLTSLYADSLGRPARRKRSQKTCKSKSKTTSFEESGVAEQPSLVVPQNVLFFNYFHKMKNAFLKVLPCVLFLSTLCVGCEQNEEDDLGEKSEVTTSQVLILNEGAYQANNAGITVYDPDKKEVTVEELYAAVNGRQMGDTGQDILVDGDDVFVSVYGSSYVARLNMQGEQQASHNFTEVEGQPRYMAADKTHLYVSLYSGNVAVLDRSTMAVTALIPVGANPEGMAMIGDRLYVANSGWGYDQTISVIDLTKGENIQTITCATNPQQFVVVNGELFLFAYGPYDENLNCPYPVQKVDAANGTVTDITNASRGTMMGFDKLLLLSTTTDWKTNTTVNTFFTYDVTMDKLSTAVPFIDAPEELFSTSIYMMECNPRTGEVYIGVSDFVSPGTVFRFSATGYLIDTFQAGINPSQAAFFK